MCARICLITGGLPAVEHHRETASGTQCGIDQYIGTACLVAMWIEYAQHFFVVKNARPGYDFTPQGYSNIPLFQYPTAIDYGNPPQAD